MYFNNVVLIHAYCLLIVRRSEWEQLYYDEKLSISNVTIPRLFKQIKQARHWTSSASPEKVTANALQRLQERY